MIAVLKNIASTMLTGVLTFVMLCAVQTAHAQDRKIDLQEAKAIVLDIPEVKAWYEKKKSEAKLLQGQGVPAAAGVHSARRMVNNQVFWAVSLIENPTTNPTRWAVFVVRARDGQISVETDSDKARSLSEWQKAYAAKEEKK